MHLLITRPREEAEALHARLAARGIRSTLAPMLEIELLPPPALDLNGVQALIATSRNGLKALAISPVLSQAVALPIYVVGPGTAALAKEIGFQRVIAGPGTARGLVALIGLQAEAQNRRLIQFGGDKLAFDLAGALVPHGLVVDVVRAYCSRPARRFPDDAMEGLSSGAIDTVVLTSPLAARTFVALAMQAAFNTQCQRLDYICLSREIAAEIALFEPGSVHVASAPNTDATLDLIERLIEHGARDTAGDAKDRPQIK